MLFPFETNEFLLIFFDYFEKKYGRDTAKNYLPETYVLRNKSLMRDVMMVSAINEMLEIEDCPDDFKKIYTKSATVRKI